MSKNIWINICYQLICLITFGLVIFYVESSLTLLLLGLCFIVLSMLWKNNLLFMLLALLIFFISYLIGSDVILRLILFTQYLYYFLYLANINSDNNYLLKKQVIHKKVEKNLIEEQYIRFANEKKERNVVKDNLNCVRYLVMHFSILFLIILVG